MTKTQNFQILKTYIEITPLEAPNVGVAIFQNSLLQKKKKKKKKKKKMHICGGVYGGPHIKKNCLNLGIAQIKGHPRSTFPPDEY